LSLPSVIMILSAWHGPLIPFLPKSILFRALICIPVIIISLLAVKKVIKNEIIAYKEQTINSKFSGIAYSGLGLFVVLFNTAALIIGLACYFIYALLPHSTGWIPLFFICVISVTFIALAYSFHCLDKNYTSYKIIIIPFSEYDIINSGSKELCYVMSVMIYGEVNDPENIELIKRIHHREAAELKKIILEKKSLDKNAEIEKQYEDNEWTAFKKAHLTI